MKIIRFGLFIFVKKFLWVRPGVLQISGSAVPQFTRTSIRNPGCLDELWDRRRAKNSYFPRNLRHQKKMIGEICFLMKQNNRWNMFFVTNFFYFSKIIHFCQEILGILATIFIPEIQFSFLNFHFQIWILVFQIWLFWILKFGIWILYIQ